MNPRPPSQGGFGGIPETPGFPSGTPEPSSVTRKHFLPISRCAEDGEDGGDFRRQEGAAGETGQMRGGGVVDEQRLELLPGRAGSDGGKIGLRQLHSSV